MAWTDAFKQRVLFNASKAYVSQAEMGYKYEDLQPVYSLNLVNEIFEKAVEIAKKMKAAGMDADTICKMTGLEKQEIERM